MKKSDSIKKEIITLSSTLLVSVAIIILLLCLTKPASKEEKKEYSEIEIYEKVLNLSEHARKGSFGEGSSINNVVSFTYLDTILSIDALSDDYLYSYTAEIDSIDIFTYIMNINLDNITFSESISKNKISNKKFSSTEKTVESYFNIDFYHCSSTFIKNGNYYAICYADINEGEVDYTNLVEAEKDSKIEKVYKYILEKN